MTGDFKGSEAIGSFAHRGDLIRCFLAFGDGCLAGVAGVLGFSPKIEAVVENRSDVPNELDVPDEPVNSPEVPEPEGEVLEEKPEWPVWRVTSFRPRERPPVREVPDWYRDTEAFKPSDWLPNPDFKPPQPVDLMPWRKLWPYLRNAFSVLSPDGQLDLPRVVRTLAKGSWPRHMPRKSRLRWAPQAILVVDYKDDLRPVWRDMKAFRGWLKTLRNRPGLQTWLVREELEQGWYHADSGLEKPFPMPCEPQPVVVLSDLGHYDQSPQAREFWLGFGKALRQRGCLPIALVPCPRDQWDRGLAAIWHMAPWDREVRLPAMGHGGVARLQPTWPRESVSATDVKDLLILMSPALGVEPELLRAMRFLFPHWVDVSVEIKAWNHPDLERFSSAVAIHETHRESYRKRFASESMKDLATAMPDLLRSFHGGWPKTVFFEEQREACQLLGIKRPEIDAYDQQLAVSLTSQHPGRSDYMARMVARRTGDNWQSNEALIAGYIKTQWPEIQAGRVQLPDGVDLHNYLWVVNPKLQSKNWWLVWEGEFLRALQLDDRPSPRDWAIGSCLLRFPSEDDWVVIKTGVKEKLEPQKLGEEFKVSMTKIDRFTLSSDLGEFEFVKWKPDEMESICFDKEGPYGTIFSGESEVKVRWLQPGRLVIRNITNDLVKRLDRKKGSWIAEDQYQIFLRSNVEFDWCDLSGFDKYGLWALVTIEGVSQHFRWIWPGEFLMGSPEDEPDRYDDEIQHKVTLTRGYWLADTACAQALWQAVMGKNPSHFRGNDLPVEKVSWEDCQRFIQRLEELRPGLEMRLPTEAEWEYACRAGTTTPFHFGTGITTDQVNYRGTAPLHGSPKGEWREKTVPVKALPANDWGLYQMHGNVDEWCSDVYSRYTFEPQVDPSFAGSPPYSGQRPVLRGGSWNNDGWFCRSAVRVGVPPGLRSLFTGFRLARGQEALQQAQGRTGAGDRQQSGTGEEDAS